MTLKIIRNDLFDVKADVIVNPTNIYLSGSGSIDKRIHEASGPLLNIELEKYNNLNVSDTLITKAYDLKNFKYIIHTIGPIYVDGNHNEFEDLSKCYQNILSIALENKLRSIAIPLISSGSFGFPKREAFNIAREEINDFLDEHELIVKLVVYDDESFSISKELQKEVEDYIGNNLIVKRNKRTSSIDKQLSFTLVGSKIPNSVKTNTKEIKTDKNKSLKIANKKSLDFKLDESFSEALIKIIDKKGLKDPDVYKKAGIDRKLFSTIRKDENYHPSKKTAVALCIALELDIDETNNLLKKAGIALSHSYKFDVIVEYFIKKKDYDLFDINAVLLENDQPLIGC